MNLITRHGCAIVIAGMAFTSAAYADKQEYQLDYRYSSLTQGLADWHDMRLLWTRTDDDRDRLSVEYRNWNRFGVSDNEIRVGERFYVRDSLQYLAEVGISDNNTLFPAYNLFGGLETKLNHQTVLTAGLRHSQYRKQDPLTSNITEPSSDAINTRLEYYFGNNMVSYSLFYTMMQGSGLSDHVSAQSLKYLYAYQIRSTVFLSIDSGGELDFVPSTTQLTSSQIDSISVGGNHWLSDHLAMVYTIAHHQVTGSGFGYQRSVIYLGLRKLTR